MDQLLISGIDSVVGANLAAHLADKFRVFGLSSTAPVSIDGCETASTRGDDAHAVRQLAARHRPCRIIVCEAAGDSAWQHGGGRIASPAAIQSARTWAQTASELDCALTLISSDAVFTGPWMYHAETSASFCPSAQAHALRTLEAWTLEKCPQALVIRTHPYGWSPLSQGPGWIEEIIAVLDSERPGIFAGAPHATPILATDLAEILPRCWEAELSGVYHVAGAERVNPHGFAAVLARVFNLASPRASILAPAETAESAFGHGETSLRTRAIHRALDLPMPMLVEGIERLFEQKNNGFDRGLRGGRGLATSKVA